MALLLPRIRRGIGGCNIQEGMLPERTALYINSCYNIMGKDAYVLTRPLPCPTRFRSTHSSNFSIESRDSMIQKAKSFYPNQPVLIGIDSFCRCMKSTVQTARVIQYIQASLVLDFFFNSFHHSLLLAHKSTLISGSKWSTRRERRGNLHYDIF